MILSAINKKQTFGELINQANAMVTSVLHDPLKRALNVMPSKCSFGPLKVGTAYEMIITVKNEDSIATRINIKPTRDKRIIVQQTEMGAIAPGLTRKITVTIKSSDEEKGFVKEEIQIITKSDIYKVPVEAQILPEEEYN